MPQITKPMLLCGALWVFSLVITPSVAVAQYSMDAATATMEASNLFVGHSNFCDSTEEFVGTGPSLSIGICMEKNLRNSGATAEFEVARRYCIEAGKRLPEPMEYKDACINHSGAMNNMANSTGEWVSNFTTYLLDSSSGSATYSVTVPMIKTTCKTTNLGVAAGYNGVATSLKFRCVR